MTASFIKRSRFFRGGYNLFRRVPRLLADNQLFGLAIRIETLLSKLSRDPIHLSRRNEYRQLGKIANQIKDLNSLDKSPYPIFVINLEQDKERLQRFDRRANRLGIRYIRINAVDTMNPAFDFVPFRSQIADTFWGGGTSIKRGSIGCHLSHAQIWKEITERNIEHSIILEDDAYPLISFPKKIDQFNLPPDYDVVYINSHAGAWFATDMRSISRQTNLFIYYPYHDLIERMLDNAGTIMGSGTYGLIISKKGAEKLLRILQQSRIFSGADRAVAMHSIERSFLHAKLKEIPEYDRKGISALPVSEVALRSYILLPSLVDHRDQGMSHIDHTNLSKRIDRSEIG